MEETSRPVLDSSTDGSSTCCNARRPAVAEVATRTGLSTTTCWRRIQQLEQSGVIRAASRCSTAPPRPRRDHLRAREASTRDATR